MVVQRYCLYGVFHIYHVTVWVSTGFPGFSPNSKAKLPLGVNMFLHDALQQTGLPSGVSSSASCLCSWGRLWVYHHPDQDKVVTEEF